MVMAEKVPKIYKGTLNSLECYNTAIEWNKAYFSKVRMAFYRRLQDASFKLDYPDDEDECPVFQMMFRVQGTDVMAFRCNNLALIDNHKKIRTYEDAMDLTLAKISEYCRNKNREIEQANKNCQLAFDQKIIVMKEMDNFVVEANRK